MKKKIDAFIEKQKAKKPLALASDIFFVILLILLVIPSTRKQIKTFATKITMTQPNVSNGNEILLSDDELSFSFRKENGQVTNLSEIKDSVVFLNFWATWCPPCRAEMPSIQNLHNEYGDKIIFALVSNENQTVIKKYLNDNDYHFPIVTPTNEPKGRLSFSTIPTTYIIGKKGELLVSKKGAAKWDGQNIKDLINNQLKN